jgi:hypothetical protein
MYLLRAWGLWSAALLLTGILAGNPAQVPRDNQGENGATNRMRMPLRGC